MASKHEAPKHEAIKHEAPKEEPKPVVKQLKMQKGTDEVNHGTTAYPVERDGRVDLPPVVAEHVLRQGGAEDVSPKPEHDPPAGFVHVRHITDPKASFGYDGVVYEPDKDGKIHAPIVCLADIEPHGFLPC